MRSIWEITGIALAILLALGGLSFVSAVVVVCISLSSWAQNK